ncbi:RagB/SusD family nutrient uptake outer membrane protein [Mucilaginibacter ginsenosidivorax]|uniref:RagB/SusD family nutrient uptake outer membrane protein n=1 Tax=Mucilaginibacter ginsenosidivorax TaxID=862126 RepID=A0A5B8WAR8_9SPHI|nr:RagB/SusD family nutrient uptake outer membrane protein [Mucilaginibacter ginsenosidivorax]QEC79995.1 RagB/SusD family nutrient uptake outer membrane protein [Mucilaginibacter ginsenosidivorax]
MKKKYILMSLVTLVTILASCKKFVDYNPHEDFVTTEQDYLKSETDYRTMVISAYSPLQWLNQMVPVGDIASDNSVTGGESASDVLSLQQIDDYTNTPINSTMTDLWQVAYEGVNRANYLTQYKDKNLAGQTVTFAGKDALYGEVYFLRAYYYFSLVRMFGDVPLFTDKRLGVTDSRTLKRSPKADVYKAIEADLTSAIAALPAVQTQKGRITKYAAQALLGKVYLYENKFDQAASTLESVITSNAFSLVADFNSIFLAAGENGPESVFEIQYTNGSPYYNWGGVTRGQGNYSVQQCGIRGLNGNIPYAAGWSTNLPSQNLASAYSAGDQRKAVTTFDIEAYKNANPALGITYQVAPYKNTGLYNGKYLPRKGETSGQVELNYLNNFRTIRYAEVLLMAAEANNRATAPNDVKAQGYLNQVRQRAFGDANHNVTLTGAALKQAIWDERRLELAMEGDRFFDLVRTGQAAAKIPGFKVGKNEVFAIPQSEVDVSGLTQNPGY